MKIYEVGNESVMVVKHNSRKDSLDRNVFLRESFFENVKSKDDGYQVPT
jgi:hypothetical protein